MSLSIPQSISMPPATKRRRLVDGFLASPQPVQELVLLHLVKEIENWFYSVAWLPLEITYKEDLGWLNNGFKEKEGGHELRLNVYVSLYNFWGCCEEEEERLNTFLLYWQPTRPCRVVVDCSWPVNTHHIVIDDDSWLVKLTSRIPTNILVLDYTEVFYENGWGWRDPPSYILRRMRCRLKRFNGRRKQAANHYS